MPDKLRTVLEGEDWQGWWLAAFRARLQRAERDAVRLYAELMRMVNGDRSVFILAIWQQLGVGSEQEAKTLIGLAKSVEGMDREATLAMARELLEQDGWRCLPPEKAIAGGNGNAASQG